MSTTKNWKIYKHKITPACGFLGFGKIKKYFRIKKN